MVRVGAEIGSHRAAVVHRGEAIFPVVPVIPPVDFDVFLNQASTCDIVLWGGSSARLDRDRAPQPEPLLAHTMVIVNPSTGERCLYQATNTAICPDPIAGDSLHAGAQAGELKATMLALLDYKDVPTWRRYTGANQNDPAFVQQVWQLAVALDGTPFPGVPLGMAVDLFAGRFEGIEITSQLFCSGLAALIFKQLGIIDQTVPCNAYFPKDFSSKYRDS